jgi:hypothetical protein
VTIPAEVLSMQQCLSKLHTSIVPEELLSMWTSNQQVIKLNWFGWKGKKSPLAMLILLDTSIATSRL